MTIKRFLVLMLLTLSAAAQVALAPNPHPIFFNSNGLPLSSGFLYTYMSGTTTRLDTFADSTGLIPNAWPIPLDATGAPSSGSVQTQIWLSNASYKFCAFDANLVQQWCADNIAGYLNLLNLSNLWTFPQTFALPITITSTDGQIITGAAGNQTTLDFPPPGTGPITLHFPNTTDTIVGRNTTDTLTNKTLTTPNINGAQVVNSPGSYIILANSSPTGTAVNDLVSLVSNNGKVTPAGTTSGVIGICVANCGTVPASAAATIQTSGEAFCNFDGAVSPGHYVQTSSTTDGTCHDAGASCPARGQVIGRSMGTLFGLGATVVNMGLNDCFPLNPTAIASSVAGAGAGTGPTISCLNCTDVGGILSVTTGTAPGTSGIIVTVTAGGTYSQYNCSFSPTNANAAALSSTTSVSGLSSSGPPAIFKLTSGSAALTGSTPYGWQYSCTYSN